MLQVSLVLLVLQVSQALLVRLEYLGLLVHPMVLVLLVQLMLLCTCVYVSAGWPWCRRPWSIWDSASQSRHPHLLAAP